jgi:hypothetical protein
LACARLLKKLPIDYSIVHIPVALSDEIQSAGTLATLVLAVATPGDGQVFHHPADAALRTYAHEDFVDAMQVAWIAAKELARKAKERALAKAMTEKEAVAKGTAAERASKEKEKDYRETGAGLVCDGYWRLVQGKQPVREVRGRSASGAAALGWYHLLNGTTPDADVIVLAQITRASASLGHMHLSLLEEVGGVPAKVEAIATDGHYDTIVVAGSKNQGEAEDTLKQRGQLGVIRVVNLAASNA